MVRVEKEEEAENLCNSSHNPFVGDGTAQTSLGVLQSASDFQIHGGNISSIGGDSTSFTAGGDVHFTINYNHSPSPTPSISISSSSSGSNSIGIPNICQDQPLEATAQSTPTIRRNCDIYRSYLSTKGRGIPLWIPEPSQNLPIQYQRKGISVGDVGVLTASGGFMFLFNALLSRNSPINPRVLPDKFTAFRLKPGLDMISRQRDLKDNSYLASPSNISARRDRGAATLTFESTKYDGAVLAMPVGAKSEDLPSLLFFREYVTTNLTSWYRYARLNLGMDIQNGDLKVVTGCDKTSAWGMACLGSSDITGSGSSSHSSSSLGSGEDHGFYLEFGPISERDGCGRGGKYEWAYSGEVAEARAGPDASEVAQLRRVRSQGGAEVSRDDNEDYENQCLFLRTMNPMLPERAWQDILLGVEENEEDEEEEKEKEEKERFNKAGAKRPFGQRYSNISRNANQRSGPSSRGSQRSSEAPVSISSRYSKTTPVARTHMVALDASEMPSVFPTRLTSFADHPSIAINKFLLQNCSQKDMMAVSLDQDWISVLRKDDETMPSSEELLKRISETYPIREELIGERTVFFDSQQYQHHLDVFKFSTVAKDTQKSEDLSIENQHTPNVFDGIWTSPEYNLQRQSIGERRKKALLIVIDGPERSSTLGSDVPTVQARETQSQKDLTDMNRMLEDLGYDPKDIVVLTDIYQADVIKPTKANICYQMDNLLRNAQAGDQLFFYLSGHGGQETTKEGLIEEEYQLTVGPDGLIISDEEFPVSLVHSLPSDSSLVGIFDACQLRVPINLPHYHCNRASLPWMNKDKKGHYSPRKSNVLGRECTVSSRLPLHIGMPPDFSQTLAADESPPDHAFIPNNGNNDPNSNTGKSNENGQRTRPDVVILSASRDFPFESLGSSIATRLPDIMGSNIKYSY